MLIVLAAETSRMQACCARRWAGCARCRALVWRSIAIYFIAWCARRPLQGGGGSQFEWSAGKDEAAGRGRPAGRVACARRAGAAGGTGSRRSAAGGADAAVGGLPGSGGELGALCSSIAAGVLAS